MIGAPLKTPFYYLIHLFEGTAVNEFYRMIRMGVDGHVRGKRTETNE